MVKKTITLIVLLAASYVGYCLLTYPSMDEPFPYTFNVSSDNLQMPDLSNVQVLIIGDKMALELEKYLPELQNNISQNFSKKLNIKIWALPQDGLHRSLFKLQQLKKWPPLIIYHGLSSEHQEKKFYPSKIPIIKHNIKLYNNPYIRTLLSLSHYFSRLIYRPMKRVPLGPEFNVQKKPLPGKYLQIKKQIDYVMFSWELTKMIKLFQSKNSHLILTTTPLNLHQHPGKVCENTTSEEITKAQKNIIKNMILHDFKRSFLLIDELKKLSYANAATSYLEGVAYKELGQHQRARRVLEIATALDCDFSRTSAIFNSLVRKFAKKSKIPLVDFDEITNNDFGTTKLFESKNFPRHPYYTKFINQLSDKMVKLIGSSRKGT